MERLDDLQFQSLTLWQDDALNRFSADAVMLTNFLRLRPGERCIDLGCGSGLISILGQGKTGASFTGVDCQLRQVELASRSAMGNRQPIGFHCMDVADAPAFFGHGSFAAAVMNPPYARPGEPSGYRANALARQGGPDSLNAFLRAAFLLIKNGGKCFLCYPCDRLAEAIAALKAQRLEPKRLCLIAADPGKAPYLALLECKKLGNTGLRMEKMQYLKLET